MTHIRLTYLGGQFQGQTFGDHEQRGLGDAVHVEGRVGTLAEDVSHVHHTAPGLLQVGCSCLWWKKIGVGRVLDTYNGIVDSILLRGI